MGLFDKLLGGSGSKRTDIRKRYEFLREAISGTMSSFYMARDRETGQIVGVKILDREKLTHFESRFKGLKKPTEGEIASKLDHPNIVKTFEFGRTPKGEEYLIMEFLEGPGLNSVLFDHKNNPLDGIRVPLIRQVAEAVKAVHEAGFIHRDICPRNIMIEPINGTLKLIDFGLTVPAKPPFMQPGNRTGTPNYMAPELVKRQATDQRLDVFAFGVTAYEICTFQLPWERGATGQAAMSHANQPPTPIQRYRPKINPKLAKAIHSCLEREPAGRCASMDMFLKMIKGVESEDSE
jgi:serine/threonine-protein kinase